MNSSRRWRGKNVKRVKRSEDYRCQPHKCGEKTIFSVEENNFQNHVIAAGEFVFLLQNWIYA